MNAPIFISYSSKDQKIAETIYQAVEARGLECWIASRDVPPGENFQEAIVGALRSAKVMLLVFTSNANNSDEIKKELVLAGRHHVTVVPVRVEDVVPNDAFTYELATRQWIDLFKDWERQIELLAARLGHVLQTPKSVEAGVAEGAAAVLPLGPIESRSPSNRALLWGPALVAVLLVAGGLTFYLRPVTPKSPAAVTTAPQIAAQIPPPAPPPAPAAAQAPVAVPPSPLPAAVPAPPPDLSPPKNPDDTAWNNATGVGTRAAFDEYLKTFSVGVHVQEAQLRVADLILNAPASAKNFDGTWQTEWTCPNFGQYPGYTYRFIGQIRDGGYHGLKGTKGEPSSLDLNGKISSDGAAAFFGEIIVGSSLVGLGAARGTPSDFHALAHFDLGSADGKRIEGRPCSLSFKKQ